MHKLLILMICLVPTMSHKDTRITRNEDRILDRVNVLTAVRRLVFVSKYSI